MRGLLEAELDRYHQQVAHYHRLFAPSRVERKEAADALKAGSRPQFRKVKRTTWYRGIWSTIDVDTLALVLGIGRNAAYEAVKNNDVPSWKIGGRILIPVPRTP